ncbi:transposase [Bacillus aquiflavi]|uniref:Transposase n=1 Tax=Bacillus aquiflavi TaxID=2672567 RepID=A0A6B3W1K7_9BACI|nr:transposase [Bacillus aquiflavi]MBA4538058.1 transposase [Bacillus aquiflavi]NEY82357.1 IS110 family transposase [Bacillus aquiflavi]UAC47861.1 transposase [Bacillus aquiflavi]
MLQTILGMQPVFTAVIIAEIGHIERYSSEEKIGQTCRPLLAESTSWIALRQTIHCYHRWESVS